MMVKSLLLSLLAGILAGNAIPHFFNGIVRRPYPNVIRNSPLVNMLPGWAGLVLAGFCLAFSEITRFPWEALPGFAVGVLLMGLFHAGGGAHWLSRNHGGRGIYLAPQDYLGPDWLEAVRYLFQSSLTSKDLEGIDFSWSEEVTEPPLHLVRRKGSPVGWNFVLKDGRVRVSLGPLSESSARIVADHAVLRFLQRFEVLGLASRREELSRLHKEFQEAGKFAVHGIERLAVLPETLREKLSDLHDRIGGVTL
jgi:hypothetical protein